MNGPPSRRPGLDLSAALARFDGNWEILEQLIRLFREDAPHLLDAVRAGLATSDLAGAGCAAHNLRGVALSFDAAPTVSAAQRVEEAADAGDLPAARLACDVLQVELVQLLAALAEVKFPGS